MNYLLAVNDEELDAVIEALDLALETDGLLDPTWRLAQDVWERIDLMRHRKHALTLPLDIEED